MANTFLFIFVVSVLLLAYLLYIIFRNFIRKYFWGRWTSGKTGPVSLGEYNAWKFSGTLVWFVIPVGAIIGGYFITYLIFKYVIR